jgi:DNA polymerase-4
MYGFRPRVAHVDMDCFFVSCERRRRPEWSGRPLVVAWGASRIRPGRRPRGVVLCASYEVRPRGLRAGMSLAEAVSRAPGALFVEPGQGLYSQMSDRVLELLGRFSPAVERASVDEFYVDLTGCCGTLSGPGDWTPERLRDVGLEIRRTVAFETGLPCTVGIARNRMLAKMAGDAAKPDGAAVSGPWRSNGAAPSRAGRSNGEALSHPGWPNGEALSHPGWPNGEALSHPGWPKGTFSLDPDQELVFLDSLPIGALPGVGRKTEALFRRLGVQTVADFKRVPGPAWRLRLGRWGEALARLARGEEAPGVRPGDRAAFGGRAADAQSASANSTLPEDTADPERLRRALLGLVERVGPRLRELGSRARVVGARVRYGDFEEHTRARTLQTATDWEPEIFRAARACWDELWRAGRAVRLVGVFASDLEPAAAGSGDLFEDRPRIGRLERSIDSIRERFGARAIRFAAGVEAR